MTYVEKLALAAEMRAGTALETGMEESDYARTRKTKVPAYVAEKGWKLSKVPLPPDTINEDWSALNPKRRGAPGGRPRKKL